MITTSDLEITIPTKTKTIQKKDEKILSDLTKKQQFASSGLHEKPKKKKKIEQIGKKQLFQVNRIWKNAPIQEKYSHGIDDQDAVMMYQQEQSNNPFDLKLFKPIVESRIYLLAGDIIVEPRFPRNEDEKNLNGEILNYYRNVMSVESYEKFLSFTMDSIRPLKLFDEVIYCLENSQDAQNYDFAQALRKYQKIVFYIQELIQQVIDQYVNNPDDLQDLLKRREQFRTEYINKMLEQFSDEGTLGCVCELTLSFSDKACHASRISFTKHSIAMIGTDFETALIHFMRKGFMDFFNHHSRRQLFRASMEQYLFENKNPITKLSSFEVITTDGIQLTCDCQVESQPIEYPENLQFKGIRLNPLNSLETINLIRLNVTPHQIVSVINLRKKQTLQNESFQEKTQMLSFEYFMRSSIFIEKNYPNEYEQILKQPKRQNSNMECGFRYLNESSENTKNQFIEGANQQKYQVLISN